MITGVDTFQLTDISFYYSSVTLCATHIPGIIVATTQAGVFYVISVGDMVSN